MSAVANRKGKDRKRRANLRAGLLAEGVNGQLIDRIIDQQRHADLMARHGLERARDIANEQAHRQDPDDTGYKPPVTDPLLNGAARVGGIAAKVVRRRDTITQFQYDKARRALAQLAEGSGE